MKLPSKYVRATLALAVAPTLAFAANHREAPITALDHKADITDVYAFRELFGGRAREPEGDADPGGRPAARARERAELVPVRSGHPLRDQGRQQQRRDRGRDVPVPVPDRAAAAGRLHDGRRLRGRRDTSPAAARPVVPPQIDDLRRSPGSACGRRYTVEHDPQRRGHADPERRTARRSSRCPATRVRARWTTRRCSTSAPTSLRERDLGLRRHHRRRRSGSTSAPPSTPPTSARWAAAFRAC